MTREILIDEFRCKNEKESWTGHIKYLKNHGSHYEMCVESRSGLLVIFGKTSSGNFLCAPNYNVGCELVDLRNRFWNKDRLISILGEIDGITIAEALYVANDLI